MTGRVWVVVADPDRCAERWAHPRARVVHTALNLLAILERDASEIATVILLGDFAHDVAYADFIKTHHPSIFVVSPDHAPATVVEEAASC